MNYGDLRWTSTVVLNFNKYSHITATVSAQLISTTIKTLFHAADILSLCQSRIFFSLTDVLFWLNRGSFIPRLQIGLILCNDFYCNIRIMKEKNDPIFSAYSEKKKNPLGQLTVIVNFFLPSVVFRIHAYSSSHTFISLSLAQLWLHSNAFKWKSIVLKVRI